MLVGENILLADLTWLHMNHAHFVVALDEGLVNFQEFLLKLWQLCCLERTPEVHGVADGTDHLLLAQLHHVQLAHRNEAMKIVIRTMDYDSEGGRERDHVHCTTTQTIINKQQHAMGWRYCTQK